MNTLIILISFVKTIGILLTICGITGLTLTFFLRKDNSWYSYFVQAFLYGTIVLFLGVWMYNKCLIM